MVWVDMYLQSATFLPEKKAFLNNLICG